LETIKNCVRLRNVEARLYKIGGLEGAVVGKLLSVPKKGAVVVIEFPDGLHEYVTTPVKRILRLAGNDVYYIETVNSRYRLHLKQEESNFAENLRSIDHKA